MRRHDYGNQLIKAWSWSEGGGEGGGADGVAGGGGWGRGSVEKLAASRHSRRGWGWVRLSRYLPRYLSR